VGRVRLTWLGSLVHCLVISCQTDIDVPWGRGRVALPCPASVILPDLSSVAWHPRFSCLLFTILSENLSMVIKQFIRSLKLPNSTSGLFDS
jgi:hypothetical protein